MQRISRPESSVGTQSRGDSLSSVGLATVVAALHLAVLARRVPVRSLHHRQTTLLAWRIPAAERIVPGRGAQRAPSKPVHTYCAGLLLLTFGMAVLTLALWLHVMRTNGTHGQ